MPDRPTIQYLLRKHLNNTLTTAEHEQLRIVLLDDEQSDECKRVINELRTETISKDSVQKISDDIVDRILLEYPARQAQVITLRSQPSRPALRWAKYAAAVILIIAGIALYYNFSHNSQPENKVVQNVPPASDKQDVSPGYNRAVLTLSDGNKIELDSAASETIKDGALSIENNNGQLIYASPFSPFEKGGRSDVRSREIAGGFNTMTTPKGGQYQLTLSDGTKVWLNAASSITYPITFTEKNRTVSITGEAYFEVAKNKTKPFIVKTTTDEITVLGTSFNVNAYADEKAMKTSLIEGSIKIGGTILQPGSAYVNGKIIKTDIQ
ncbi:MAG: FecR domain-containing protein, partial [Chitinophagaceae bacterium]|nr:FecR domain-containing protein [Chitinophagaceae bacterium]